jgi:hypothetical protein
LRYQFPSQQSARGTIRARTNTYTLVRAPTRALVGHTGVDAVDDAGVAAAIGVGVKGAALAGANADGIHGQVAVAALRARPLGAGHARHGPAEGHAARLVVTAAQHAVWLSPVALRPSVVVGNNCNTLC